MGRSTFGDGKHRIRNKYVGREHFRSQGPARVILGRYGDATSKVSAPTTINYLDVALKKGEKWRYQPPDDHTVAWVAVHEGKLATADIVDNGELAVFEETNTALEFEALEDTGFILGRPSGILTILCSATIRFIRARRRSKEAKQRSQRSASALRRTPVSRQAMSETWAAVN